MDLLVALEMEHDAVIAPREFSEFKSLNDIVARVELGTNVPGVAEITRDHPGAGSDASAGAAEPAPPIVRLFRRALRRCRGVGHVNKALQTLEHHLTPLEAATLIRWHEGGQLIPAQAPVHFEMATTDWMGRLSWMMARSGKIEPEPFTSDRVAPAVLHFIGPGERAEKTLLLGFTTRGSRKMWMPHPVLLQHADARRFDLLIVSDPWTTAFRAGVPSMGQTIDEVIRWIADLELVGEYGRVRTWGCSAGAYPAILTAPHVKAELAVGFGGRFPLPNVSNIQLGISMFVNCWVAAYRNRRERILLVHSKPKRDKAFARRLSWVTRANRLSVKSPGRKMGHHVLEPLLEHGELGYLLDRSLFAPVDEAPLAKKGKRVKVFFPVDSDAAAAAKPLVRS